MTERWRDRIVEIRRMRIGDILPHPFNPRTHPERQTTPLRAHLDETGKTRIPMAYYSERNGGALTFTDGHGREGLDPNEIWTIGITDLTDAEADLDLAIGDPLAALAGQDDAQVAALMREVSTDNPVLQQLLEDIAHEAGIGIGIAGGGGDDFDGTPIDGPTRTQLGDLWIIAGVHRLLVGDCTDPELVASLLQGQQPRLMVTDPPYGVNYDPSWRADVGINNNTERMGTVENDERFDWREAYQAFEAQVLYVWHAGKYSGDVQLSIIEAGYQIVSQIIWCKDKFALSRGDYHWQHEPCWYAVREGANHNWQGARDQSTVWHIKRESVDEGEWGHGTQKPLECMQRPIENNTAAGDLVVDPFLGSGTTLIAAHRMKRVCYGMEIAPAYADVILRRAEAEGLTVERATLANIDSGEQ